LIPDICSTDLRPTQNYSFVSTEYLKGSSFIHSVPAFRGCSKSPDMPDPPSLVVLQQYCVPQKSQHSLFLRRPLLNVIDLSPNCTVRGATEGLRFIDSASPSSQGLSSKAPLLIWLAPLCRQRPSGGETEPESFPRKCADRNGRSERIRVVMSSEKEY
jgi:hypothetical protein